MDKFEYILNRNELPINRNDTVIQDNFLMTTIYFNSKLNVMLLSNPQKTSCYHASREKFCRKCFGFTLSCHHHFTYLNAIFFQDLEAYSTQYKGLARLSRLVYIADHCPPLRVEALRLALTHVMTTYNTGMYQQLHKKLQEAITR